MASQLTCTGKFIDEACARRPRQYSIRASATLLVLVILATGCVSTQRRIVVNSNPEGALVTIDHQPIGHTPVAVPFTYYGTREVRVEMDGFQTQTVKHRFRAPWYQIPPVDFISDNFWPREIHDDRMLNFQLSPLEIVDENYLLDRAGQLRANSGRGTVPLPLAHQKQESPVDTPPQRTAESGSAERESPSVLDRFR